MILNWVENMHHSAAPPQCQHKAQKAHAFYLIVCQHRPVGKVLFKQKKTKHVNT